MPPLNLTTLGPGARLRAAREAAGLTRRELAERLGVGYGSISNVELGTDTPTLDLIHRMAVAIGCDPHAIDPRLAPVRRVRTRTRTTGLA
jgi:transcriptional regulator with XRE-family HTH domain